MPSQNNTGDEMVLAKFSIYVSTSSRHVESLVRIGVVGNAPDLGAWDLSKSVALQKQDSKGDAERTMWVSPKLEVPKDRFPLKLRIVANGHRSSPNTRPLLWDRSSRWIHAIPSDGVIRCDFDPTACDSDTGWVHPAGVGAYQLRVGVPPGSSDPLVELESHLQQPHRVQLYEAVPTDPAAPQGKAFARLTYEELHGTFHHSKGSFHPEDEGESEDAATFLISSQSIEALAFRVDVVSTVTDGTLIARGFVSHRTLTHLEGSISAALMTPDLQQAGMFKATFLVVTALEHPANNLSYLQRERWVPGRRPQTLDIGHRGSGASKVQGHSVRENTLLSFQKAEKNHSEVIEFDVHVCADDEVVIHHDYDITLELGTQVVKIPVASLNFNQLQSREINRFMVHPSLHAKFPAFEGEKTKLQGSLKRCMTSGEDMVRAAFKPQLATSPEVGAPGLAAASRVFLSDRVASLREVFRQTPRHLGFNVELKYPTAAEAAAMRTKIRPRNELVDAVLRVALEEGRGRKIIFSTFDPDCATLLSLKQPRYPVFFLTCGGAKDFADPRMNSLEAALQFALASHLQGVVAEAGSVLPRLHEVVEQFHCHGLFLFTWGEINNDIESYLSQREAGVDAIIIDDVARIARATNKQISLFNTKSIKSPASLRELMTEGAASMPAPGHFDTDALTGMLESLSGISMVALGAMEAPSSNA